MQITKKGLETFWPRKFLNELIGLRLEEIHKSIKAKNSLLKAFLKNKDQFNYHRYKYYGNKLNHLIWDSKKQYYINFFNKNKQSALQISVGQWSIITNLWPLTVHIYHLMIIGTGGFFKKYFFFINIIFIS